MARRGEATEQLMVEGEPAEEQEQKVPVSFAMVYWIGFLLQLENNVILPTIWAYVRHHFESSIITYGAILSVAAVAEVLGAIILGFWSDRRPLRHPLIAALILFIAGNLVYISAWDLNVWIVMAARFISGLGYGGASIVLAFITHHSSTEQRNNKIAYYWLTCLSTNIVGPLVTYLINLAYVKASPSESRFLLNEVTLPALFNIVFYLVNAIFIAYQWSNSITHHVPAKSLRTNDNVITGFWNLVRSLSLLAFVCLYIKLVFSLLVSVFQAIASPITDQDTSTNSLLFVAIGALIMFGVFLAKVINRCISDYNTLQVGQIAAFVSLFGLLKWPIENKDLADGLFGMASILLTIGNSIAITVCTIAYSKAIGQHNPNKGVLMGWFVGAAAGGRILGPILSCAGLETVGLNVVGGVLIGMGLLAIVSLFYSRVRMHYVQLHDHP